MNREERRAFGKANGIPMPPVDPQPQPGLQFSPVPVNTAVQQVDGPDGALVVLVITTPQGVAGYFLSPEHAKSLASQLQTIGTAAASGLQIVGNLDAPATNGDGA